MFISKENHSTSQYSNSMPEILILKKLKLISSVNTYKVLSNNAKNKKKKKKERERDFFFTTGDWNAKGGSQETPETTGKFGLAVQNTKSFVNRTCCSKQISFPTTQETILHKDVVHWRMKWQPTTVFWTQGHHYMVNI